MTKQEKKRKKNFVMRRGESEPTEEWLNKKATCELCGQEWFVNVDNHTCNVDELFEKAFKENFDQSEWGADGSEAFEKALKIGFEYVRIYRDAYFNKTWAAPAG